MAKLSLDGELEVEVDKRGKWRSRMDKREEGSQLPSVQDISPGGLRVQYTLFFHFRAG